jgi:hypothetical protein
VIDALALAALARAVDGGGDVDTAHAILGRADPLLRAAARRRLRTAHADALLAARDQHADEGRHALRLAYLMLARALPARHARDDVAAVQAAYEEARARRPARGGFWWATTALVLALAGTGGAIAATVKRMDGPLPPAPAPHVAEKPAPAPRGAFATGGTPAPLPGDEVIRRVFAKDLPAFLIALDRLSDARRTGAAPDERASLEQEVEAARARAAGADVTAALGEGAARALTALMDAAAAAAGAKTGAADDALAEATGVLDDTLAAAGAGYFVDGDVIESDGRRLVLAYAFAVERVSLFAAGSEAVRALHVRRIDRLNWSHTLLGFSRPHLRSAVVLLDQLEEQALDLTGPALAAGAPLRLFDDDPDGVPADVRAAVEARAGEIARASFGALPGLEGASGLGEVLRRRREVLQALEKRAESRGATLVVPGKLRLPEGFAAQLEGFATKEELAALAKADKALERADMERTFGALRDAVAASVERHEVQHRLDARKPLAMPKALADLVGPAEKDGHERRHAATARAELSAYLAELARDAQTGAVGLGSVARFLFQRRSHGTPECYAAVVILEGLADTLGLPKGDPLVARGAVDRRAAGRLYLALAAQPPERVREAAKRLWEQLFAAPLADLRTLSKP